MAAQGGGWPEDHSLLAGRVLPHRRPGRRSVRLTSGRAQCDDSAGRPGPGDLAYVVPVAVSGHELGGSIGELVAFTYAAEGDGKPFRARVLEIRENIHASHTSAQVQLGAIPAGQRMRVFVHATEVNNGDLDINIRSGSQGGVTTSRAFRNNWAATGFFELTIDGPITHDWWDVHYTSVSGAFDMAVAVVIE